jgi:two-component system nitrate/nitrite response regulator NarL
MPPSTSQKSITILIIDADNLVREGLRALMLGKPWLQIIGDTDNGKEALLLAQQHQPDVILLDPHLEVESRVSMLPELLKASSRCRVLVLTNTKDAEQHRNAMLQGASGVVEKHFGSAILFKAIEKVHAGEIWYDRSKLGSVLRDILLNSKGKAPNPIEAKIGLITPREHEVIALVSLGMKNRDIGLRLFISETTVRHHLTSVFEKLEVSNRLELIIFAFSHGLASLPDNPQPLANGHRKMVTSLLELTM